MAYLTRRFTYCKHENSGIDGWLPDSAKHNELFLPSEGNGVAHDTLEHPKLDGTLVDEMLEFGHIWYIRVEGDGSVQANTIASSDLPHIFHDEWERGTHHLPDLGCPRNGYEAIEQGYDDSLLPLFMQTVEDDTFRDADLEGESLEEARREAEHWFLCAMNLMRRGYQQAAQRWRGRGSLATRMGNYEAASLYQDLKDAVDELHGEEGDTLTIHVNILRRTYTLHHKDAYGFNYRYL